MNLIISTNDSSLYNSKYIRTEYINARKNIVDDAKVYIDKGGVAT
jgi:hypothetical protein